MTTSRRVLATARSLRFDLSALEVAENLQLRGVRSLLMKGPTAAFWLYDDGALRPYDDIDLLVRRDDVDTARAVLAQLSFRLVLAESDFPRPAHGDTWRRNSDGAVVDLHHTLPGAGPVIAEVWRTLWNERLPLPLAGASVDALGRVGTALVAALHAAHHGAGSGKPLTDLARALERFGTGVWTDAALLADRLDALPSFTLGLELVPAGQALAEELELPAPTALKPALVAGSAPPVVRGFADLGAVPGIRAKAILLAREIVPSRRFMRFWSPLARRSRLGLGLAYLWRPVWLLVRAGPAFVTFRRAKADLQRRNARR